MHSAVYSMARSLSQADVLPKRLSGSRWPFGTESTFDLSYTLCYKELHVAPNIRVLSLQNLVPDSEHSQFLQSAAMLSLQALY